MKQLYAISSFLCLAALLAASCTTSLTDEPDTTARAIAFSTPQAGTRAAVNGTSLTSGSFDVWGWYGDNGTNDVNVFDGEKVTGVNSVWTYYGGTRYWIPGKTYNFYAVHPAGVAEYDESNQVLTVDNFQCPTTLVGMADVTDLMTAYKKGMEGSNPQLVDLNFKHALTRINIAVKLADDMPAGYRVDINFINFIANTKGIMRYQLTDADPVPQWTADENSYTVFNYDTNTLENHTNITATGSTNTAVDITPEDYDLYLIPQTMVENGQSIKISYRLKNEVAEGTDGYRYIDNEIEISLTKASVATWQPGESLTYTVGIGRYNATVMLEVGDWVDGNSGNESVDFD